MEPRDLEGPIRDADNVLDALKEAQQALEEAISERDDARQEAEGLRDEVAELESQVDDLSDELRTANQRSQRLAATVQILRDQVGGGGQTR